MVLSLSEKWELLTQYMLNSNNNNRKFYHNIQLMLEEVLSKTNTYVRDKSGRISGKTIHGLFTVGVSAEQGLSCGGSIVVGMVNNFPGIGEALLIPLGIPIVLISTLVGFCVGVNKFATQHFISTDEQKHLFAKTRTIYSHEEKDRIIARVVAEYNDTCRCMSHSSFNLMEILASRWVSTETKFKRLVEYTTKNIGVITENNGKRLFVIIQNAILQSGNSIEIKGPKSSSGSIYNSIFISNYLHRREEKLFFQQLDKIQAPALKEMLIENVKNKYEASRITSSLESRMLISILKHKVMDVDQKFNSLKSYMQNSSENNGKKLFAIIKKEIMKMADENQQMVQAKRL